jgi:DNA-binding transcriptional LysR family regulator
MTFEQMRIFLEAAHFGSFTIAAERLGLTQSAVSVSVKKLEEKHDVLLFDRSGRRLILTDAGQVLLNEAERILRDVELTIRRVESRRSTDQCAIVACTPNAYDFWMPQLSAGIEAIDGAQVDLVRGSVDEVTSWVMRGTADFGITNVIPSHPQFRQIGVFADRIILCGRPEKAQAIPDGLAWARLIEHRPIVWEQGDLTPALVAALDGHRVDITRIVHPRLKLTSSMAVFSALQSGRYIGFVPEKAASAMLASQDLTRIGSIEVSVRYWMFALRERELEPIASRVAKAASQP